jgi:hypothetical protein
LVRDMAVEDARTLCLHDAGWPRNMYLSLGFPFSI